MKKYALVLTALALTAGCQKAADHVTQEIGNDKAKAETAGTWVGPCDTTNFVSAAAGIKSSQTSYDLYSNTGRTTALFGDDQCKNKLAQATYTGTATLGTTTTFDSNAHIIDLNYTNVSISVSDQSLLNFLNNPVTPGCGINDWQLNQGRDVTADVNSAQGAVNCPYVAKPAQLFDIVKADGQTLHFGVKDAAHDGSTQDKRPVAVDTNVSYTKQ